MKKHILTTTLIAGSLDIFAACLQAYLTSKIMPSIVLQYVASGFFGQSAFKGGLFMEFCGLIFHFLIVFCCTASYFVLYPKIAFLKKNWIFNCVLIALVAWIITTLIIVPMSKIPNHPFNFSNALIGFAILIFSIGVPISFLTKKFYYNKKNNPV